MNVKKNLSNLIYVSFFILFLNVMHEKETCIKCQITANQELFFFGCIQ